MCLCIAVSFAFQVQLRYHLLQEAFPDLPFVMLPQPLCFIMVTALRTDILKLYVFVPHPLQSCHEPFQIRSYHFCIPSMCPRAWHLGVAQLILN